MIPGIKPFNHPYSLTHQLKFTPFNFPNLNLGCPFNLPTSPPLARTRRGEGGRILCSSSFRQAALQTSQDMARAFPLKSVPKLVAGQARCCPQCGHWVCPKHTGVPSPCLLGQPKGPSLWLGVSSKTGLYFRVGKK